MQNRQGGRTYPNTLCGGQESQKLSYLTQKHSDEEHINLFAALCVILHCIAVALEHCGAAYSYRRLVLQPPGGRGKNYIVSLVMRYVYFKHESVDVSNWVTFSDIL